MTSVRPQPRRCSWRGIKGRTLQVAIRNSALTQSRDIQDCCQGTVLPGDHLWQALFVSFDPAYIIPPSCKNKKCKSFDTKSKWHLSIPFAKGFLRGKGVCFRQRIATHLSTGTEASLSYFSAPRHWHRRQRAKRARPSVASLPCPTRELQWRSDRWMRGQWNSARCFCTVYGKHCHHCNPSARSQHTTLTKQAWQGWESNDCMYSNNVKKAVNNHVL